MLPCTLIGLQPILTVHTSHLHHTHKPYKMYATVTTYVHVCSWWIFHEWMKKCSKSAVIPPTYLKADRHAVRTIIEYGRWTQILILSGPTDIHMYTYTHTYIRTSVHIHIYAMLLHSIVYMYTVAGSWKMYAQAKAVPQMNEKQRDSDSRYMHL